MSSALVVEKTSHRGGKIIHEKDLQRSNQETEMASTMVASGIGMGAEQLPVTNLLPNATEACIFLILAL